MKKHVLFIHGAGEGAYEEDQLLAASLQAALGSAYAVHYPRMRNEESPEYTDWKAQITFQDIKVYRKSKIYTDEQKAQILDFFNKIFPAARRQIIADFAARVPHAKIIEIPYSHHYCFLYNENQVYKAMREFYDGCLA